MENLQSFLNSGWQRRTSSIGQKIKGGGSLVKDRHREGLDPGQEDEKASSDQEGKMAKFKSELEQREEANKLERAATVANILRAKDEDWLKDIKIS